MILNGKVEKKLAMLVFLRWRIFVKNSHIVVILISVFSKKSSVAVCLPTMKLLRRRSTVDESGDSRD